MNVIAASTHSSNWCVTAAEPPTRFSGDVSNKRTSKLGIQQRKSRPGKKNRDLVGIVVVLYKIIFFTKLRPQNPPIDIFYISVLKACRLTDKILLQSMVVKRTKSDLI